MALITVMVVVAIVVAISSRMMLEHQLDVRRAANLLHGDQVIQHLLALETWAREVLLEDRQEGTLDHERENWATQIAPIAADGGLVAGRILDQQGLFNLNNLLDESGRAEPGAKAQLERLIRQVSEDGGGTEAEALVNAIVDWLDPDSEVSHPGGAEDLDYAVKDPAYRTAGASFVSPTELLLVEGMTYELLDSLRPYVTALPDRTSLNVNTAPTPVLQALSADIDEDLAGELVRERGEDPFDTAEQFRLRLKNSLGEAGMEQLDGAALGVASDYFLVESQARFGDVALNMRHLLARPGNETRVLLRSLGESW
ncbi:MAG: type II secretion system minor pseudopilin GspK [Pseudomonadota bacterium]